MKFTKMQGLGNDFILVNTFEENVTADYSELAKKLCDRHFGIGADGLVFVLPSEKADVRMRIINSDGSEAEMCGNVIRCFARLVYERHIIRKPVITVETLAGIKVPELIFEGDQVVAVRVDMGEPQLERAEIPMTGQEGRVVNETLEVDDERVQITCVSMGNPHCIQFVSDVKTSPVTTLGPKIETHPLFPRKTNVEFVHVMNRQEVDMRVWERGAGETMACGTGASAVGVACVLNGLTDRKVTVHLPGGDLVIEWAENNHVYMTGPGESVFTGEVEI